ncbi:PanM family protein [Pseudomonas nitroreducens]|uniref:acetyl-CoA sensor PanZ family protein n=1 Tax=Pseudomonas TaxID=286 RepID=UPI00055A7B96|nr:MULTISPECIES: acetyl-CoA sensor PanZ family protein [Pseudomonas]MCJ1880873.1 PanM family protein [Pseudomonas nitroreducens]MCJ1895609.1 PanM family protein [Pseudomonas nitroreducens]MDG9856327.1 PanM family protein [Pseudomonas nitroreducens]MDH1073695.1 PanM family protein [Pseudomonas nitroreducens]NMZ71653.1 PanM family protein [Pseudomonas nitroreducens]
MPVVVQHLTQPSDQDRQDLLKIYADAPDWLLAPFPDAGELVERGLADGLLFTGRFNDRLLGAAWIERDGDTWRLSRLCVRQVTRGRGVARRLLEEAQRLAVLQGAALRLTAPDGKHEAAVFAEHLGLTLETT